MSGPELTTLAQTGYISDMKNGTTIRFLSVTEAAKELGYASRSTLLALAKDEKIPGAIKIGATWAIPDAWVESQKKEGKPKGKGGPRGKGVRGKNK